MQAWTSQRHGFPHRQQQRRGAQPPISLAASSCLSHAVAIVTSLPVQLKANRLHSFWFVSCCAPGLRVTWMFLDTLVACPAIIGDRVGGPLGLIVQLARAFRQLDCPISSESFHDFQLNMRICCACPWPLGRGRLPVLAPTFLRPPSDLPLARGFLLRLPLTVLPLILSCFQSCYDPRALVPFFVPPQCSVRC